MILRGRHGDHPGLIADLYHPDAAYVAWHAGLSGLATFDLYARRAPFGGAFVLTAGLAPALEFLQAFHFAAADLAYLGRLRHYDDGFLAYLGDLRFSGDVLAMLEGSIAFPNEPILRVTAPYPQALLVESGLLQAINGSSLIATKAARVVYAAEGRAVAEFALRRALEPYTVARASFIAGAASTSFLAAALRYDIPASGTIPHALVQLFPSEEAAFRAVAATFARYTLLLDTYDPYRAVQTAVRVAHWAWQAHGHRLVGVRLDSGDLAAIAQHVRNTLDDGGLNETRILVSGDMDEYSIAELLAQRAPIDGFGVGTSLGAAGGSLEHGVLGGALGGVYKLVWYDDAGAGRAVVKVAGAKSTWPGMKQVHRLDGFGGDVVALDTEPPPARSASMLMPVMRAGRALPAGLPPLDQVRAHAQESLAALPQIYRRLIGAAEYPVQTSAALKELRRRAVGRERQPPSLQE